MAMPASIRGTFSGKSARATVATRAAKGSVKNTSRLVPASRSSAQISEQKAKAKKAAAGRAIRRGRGRSSCPRRARQPSAALAAASTK